MARANALRSSVDRSRFDTDRERHDRDDGNSDQQAASTPSHPSRRPSARSGGRRPSSAAKGDLSQPSGNRVSFVEGFVADDGDGSGDDDDDCQGSLSPTSQGQRSPTARDPREASYNSLGRELTPLTPQEGEGENSLGRPSPRHPGAPSTSRRRRRGEYTARESKGGAAPDAPADAPAFRRRGAGTPSRGSGDADFHASTPDLRADHTPSRSSSDSANSGPRSASRSGSRTPSAVASDFGSSALVLSRSEEDGERPHRRSISFHAAA